ncbi:hypothetical protein ACFX11_008345 [Malus domestica]
MDFGLSVFYKPGETFYDTVDGRGVEHLVPLGFAEVGDQNYCSSSNSNPLSYGDSSSQICQNDFPVPFMSSCDLNSLPTIKADAASCVTSQHQFTTDQEKNLENEQFSALLKFLMDEGFLQNIVELMVWAVNTGGQRMKLQNLFFLTRKQSLILKTHRSPKYQ